MTLDRLTKRAASVLNALPQEDFVTTDLIIKSLNEVGGMGGILLEKGDFVYLKKKKIYVVDLLKEAYFQSSEMKHAYVGTEHLLLAVLKLSKSEKYEDVRAEVNKLNFLPGSFKSLDKLQKNSIFGSFGTNLNQKYIKSLDENLVYREVYETLVSSILLKSSSNVLLVGDSGVGKNSLVNLLAKNIVSLQVPPILAGYQIYEIDILSLMSSMLNKGSIEINLNQLVDGVGDSSRTILYLKNFQSIFNSSSAGISMPMFYSMFLSSVNDLGIKVIATMNTGLYERLTLDNEQVLEGFSFVKVDEPNEEKSIEIIKKVVKTLSEEYNIRISKECIQYVFDKSDDLNVSYKFPKKAVSFLDYCCAHTVIKKSKIPENYSDMVDESYELAMKVEELLDKGKYEDALELSKSIDKYEKKLVAVEEKVFVGGENIVLTLDDIDDAFDNLSQKDSDNSVLDLAGIPSLTLKLKKRIIGQNDAINVVTKSLIRSRLGLRSRKRPLGNFLFLGPTGVGKTELAKVLSDVFFGEKALIRLDMSDFSEKHNVARLIGAPPGYVGYGEGGELTSKIENNPNSLVLFDEIEKAHPDVLNILLQIMEEGELSDAKGQTYDFSKSVVVLTSNLGTEILHGMEIGFAESEKSEKKIEDRLRNNLKKILKPELLNRFDEIVVFKSLGREEQFRVLDLLIEEIGNSLKEQEVNLKVNKGVKKYLLNVGYSKEYGARGLRRSMERELLDKIAEVLLKHEERPLSLKAKMKDKDIDVSIISKR